MTPRRAPRIAVLLTLAGVCAVAVLTAVLPIRASADRAHDEASGALLVAADLRGHALVVFDPAQPERARRFALPGGPHELVRLPDGRLLASLEQFGSLAVIDLVTGGVEEVRTGGLPHGLAVHGDTLYVTDRAAGAVRRFTLDSWTEAAPLARADTPHAVAVLSDGTAVIANAGDSTLVLGDAVLAVSALPETVAVSSDGARVATAGARGGALQVFDTRGAPVTYHEVGGRPVRVAFAPTGDGIASALSAVGAVAIVDGRGWVRSVAVGGVPDGLAYSEDGRRLYAGEVSEGIVSVLDVADGRVTARYDIGESAGTLLFVTHAGRLGGAPTTVVRQ